MSNMSYCRFQNTLRDFRDCASALTDMIEGESNKPLSEYEFEAAKDLVQEAWELIRAVADFDGLTIEQLVEKEHLADRDGVVFESIMDLIQENASTD